MDGTVNDSFSFFFFFIKFRTRRDADGMIVTARPVWEALSACRTFNYFHVPLAQRNDNTLRGNYYDFSYKWITQSMRRKANLHTVNDK